MPSKGYKKSKPQYKCEKCSYKTLRKSIMDDHKRVHTGERPFCCGICGKGFTQKSNLGQHLKVHGAGDQKTYTCDQCDFSTKWKTSLLQHVRWHKGEKPFQCHICKRTFSQSTHCRSHMRESHYDVRRYQCDLCSKCFKRQDHLDRHIMFHKNDRKYECDVCHKKYVEQRYLAIHKRVHQGESSKRYKCDMCPYKSRYKQGLDVHYRIHTGVRPHVCKDCGKTFIASQSLKLHSRMIHQGLAGKIFKCDRCSFSTANKQSLKKHVERIHMGVKEELDLKCPYCTNSYKSRASLYSHKQKKHPRMLKKELVARKQRKLRMLKKSVVIGSISETSVLDVKENNNDGHCDDVVAEPSSQNPVEDSKDKTPIETRENKVVKEKEPPLNGKKQANNNKTAVKKNNTKGKVSKAKKKKKKKSVLDIIVKEEWSDSEFTADQIKSQRMQVDKEESKTSSTTEKSTNGNSGDMPKKKASKTRLPKTTGNKKTSQKKKVTKVDVKRKNLEKVKGSPGCQNMQGLLAEEMQDFIDKKAEHENLAASVSCAASDDCCSKLAVDQPCLEDRKRTCPRSPKRNSKSSKVNGVLRIKLKTPKSKGRNVKSSTKEPKAKAKGKSLKAISKVPVEPDKDRTRPKKLTTEEEGDLELGRSEIVIEYDNDPSGTHIIQSSHDFGFKIANVVGMVSSFDSSCLNTQGLKVLNGNSSRRTCCSLNDNGILGKPEVSFAAIPEGKKYDSLRALIADYMPPKDITGGRDDHKTTRSDDTGHRTDEVINLDEGDEDATMVSIKEEPRELAAPGECEVNASENIVFELCNQPIKQEDSTSVKDNGVESLDHQTRVSESDPGACGEEGGGCSLDPRTQPALVPNHEHSRNLELDDTLNMNIFEGAEFIQVVGDQGQGHPVPMTLVSHHDAMNKLPYIDQQIKVELITP